MTMKKYKSIGKLLALSFLTAIAISSCTEDAMDKVNKDPNHPETAPAKFLVTDLGTSTAFNTVGGDFSLYTSVYMEHEVGVGNQLYKAEIRNGEPSTATTYNNAWISLYANIKNAKIAIQKCENDDADKGNVLTEAIAKIFLAYNAGVAADMFGDTPFTETGILNPDGTPAYMQPKIDSQESIYNEVQKNLDEAIILLDDGKAKDEGLSGAIGSKDLIYGKSSENLGQAQAALWLKAAYALKARYTMHLLNKSSDQTTDLRNILTYISKSFQSSDEEFKLAIYDGDTQLNPLFSFSYSRNSLGASQSLIDKFMERNDPRSFQSFNDPDQGVQATNLADINAAPNGTTSEAQYEYGTSIACWSATTPTQLLSFHELKFLEAEALCRLEGGSTNAEGALKEAIVAAFANLNYTIKDGLASWGMEGSATLTPEAAEEYFTKSVKPLFTADPLKETMIQKYLAFFGAAGESVEAYNDYRRLKAEGKVFVTLKNPLNTNKFPQRLGYGADDVIANPAVKAAFGDGQYVYTEPVWWAGGTR